jgi:hypothetical protein
MPAMADPEHAVRLHELGAPDDVVRWAARHGTFDEAWEASPSARCRLWLAAIEGVPVETIAESAAAAFFAVVEDAPEHASLARAVEKSVASTHAKTAAKQAERCEAGSHATASYRDRDRSRDTALATCAAQICRAFEALRAAEADREAERMREAHTRASILAIGVQAALPPEVGPMTLLSTRPGTTARDLLYAVITASVDAVDGLARAGDPSRVDEVVWDTLSPS